MLKRRHDCGGGMNGLNGHDTKMTSEHNESRCRQHLTNGDLVKPTEWKT